MNIPLKKRLSNQLSSIEGRMLKVMDYDACHPHMSQLFNEEHELYNIFNGQTPGSVRTKVFLACQEAQVRPEAPWKRDKENQSGTPSTPTIGDAALRSLWRLEWDVRVFAETCDTSIQHSDMSFRLDKKIQNCMAILEETLVSEFKRQTSAKKIQRAWRLCISDPRYLVTRKRLLREYQELVS